MTQFPFTAIVGSDDLALALTLTAVSPEVGGVLVRGEKGTAKSTMVRALAALLPPVDVVVGCRFSCSPTAPDPTCPDGPHAGANLETLTRPARLVELPVGATEDRVIGSLHLERALSAGVAEYEPGLLAAAHRGLLYVDEVNLLHDHLVDLLLDAAAMGRSTVEREGVSVAHAARFVLVGTMNPEEGELRPQLLDRFGLTVEVAAPRDPAVRVEVVRRRMAYDADPAGFTASYASRETALAQRIADARRALPDVKLGEDALLKIAEVCAAFEVDGMRADIITARTAIAHAALAGRDEVTRTDIRAAARLAIPHRRRRNPFDAPGLDEALLDAILGDDPEPPTDPQGDGFDTDAEAVHAETDTSKTTEQPSAPEGSSAVESGQEPQPTAHSNAGFDSAEGPRGADGGPSQGTVTAPAATYRARLFRVTGIGEGEAGRRSRAITSTGRTIGATTNPGSGIHLPATVRAAAPHQLSRGRENRLVLAPADLRRPVREGRESNLVLFCVDASGSMAAHARMEQVKAAALSLLLDAYQRRDKVGLITFRGSGAELVLPPTGSVDVAAARLRDLATGGRTPLAEGLLRAVETLRLERIRDPRRRPLLVVVTDGRATAGPDAMARAARAAGLIANQGIATLVVDCETGRFRLGLAATLATQLDAEYVPLGEVSAAALTDTIRATRKAA